MKARGRVAKGNQGMDEFARFLRDLGVTAERGHGTDCRTSIKAVHFEVKRQEKSRPYEWLSQAWGDSNTIPGIEYTVVAHRQNYKPWIAIITLGELMCLFEKAGMIK
jgi:hypothetical protein